VDAINNLDVSVLVLIGEGIDRWKEETALADLPALGVEHRTFSKLADYSDAFKARESARSYIISGERDEKKWQDDVWNKALGKEKDAWETR
jgi:hypothetical protein